MDARFSSAVAKVARANEHIEDFVSHASTWTEGNPSHVVAQRNAESTEHTIKVVFDREPDVLRWGLLVGDCLSNLRSALDHLVYALAIAESGEDPPPGENVLQFPIASTEDEFSKVRWHIRVLSDTSQAAIERMQPYKRIQRIQRHPLLLLNELNNRDKHRTIQVAAVRGFSGFFEVSGFSKQGKVTRQMFLGTMETNTPLLILTTEKPEPNLYVKVDVTSYVAIRHTPGSDGETYSGADWLLEHIRNDVAWIVTEFERLLPDR